VLETLTSEVVAGPDRSAQSQTGRLLRDFATHSQQTSADEQ